MNPPLRRLLALLDEAADLKLLRHEGGRALALLREAETLCEAHEDLPATLRGLAAYRLGHLRMRDAADGDGLAEAEQDFRNAARRAPTLAPWAGLYHLAVLGRMARVRPSPYVAASIGTCWNRVLREIAAFDPAAAPGRDDPILQQGPFNAAEALGYALGLPMTGLEGLGAVERDLHRDADWGFLAGAGLAQVRLPWPVAEAALSDLRAHGPARAVFLLPPEGREALLWAPGATDPTFLGTLRARLLTWVLLGCPGGDEGSDARVFGRPATPAARRKLLQRTREDLAAAFGRHGADLLRRDECGGLALAPDLDLIGAVHGARWERP